MSETDGYAVAAGSEFSGERAGADSVADADSVAALAKPVGAADAGRSVVTTEELGRAGRSAARTGGEESDEPLRRLASDCDG
jgi:hypothetical protein